MPPYSLGFIMKSLRISCQLFLYHTTCRLWIVMPQDLCDGCERRSRHQKLFCQPPPESMEPFPIKGMAVNLGFPLVLLKHTSNADRIRQPCPGGNQAQKYFRALRARPCIQDIILQGFSRLLNQRGIAGAPCFSLGKSDFALPPVVSVK